jgi:hypothetical protein
VALTQPLYALRAATTKQIPNFWPLVLEQAPADIDQYIQPSDSAVLLGSLTGVEVEHFEIGEEGGDPRSVLIRFGFAENEYFTDAVLEKRFWHRRARDGWAGLVSEPVPIQWKEGRDLTGGLLGMVCRAWEREQEGKGEENKGLSEEQKALKKKIDSTGMGGLSFFAWFGFIGRRVSAEESAKATKLDREGKLPVDAPKDDDEEEGENEDDLDMSLEIFPDGDDLAVAISEDLWPGAIKYFSASASLPTPLRTNSLPAQAQEQDALSDADFESDDDQLDEAEGPGSGAESGEERPPKRFRT